MDSLRRCPPWIPVVIAAPVAYYTARYLWELVTVRELKNKAVFVTGCDSGFGYLLAVKLAKEAGMTVFAGCLTESGKRAIAEENSGLGDGAKAGRIVSVPLDVTDEDSCRAAARFVERNLGDGQYLWALVNNAGRLALYGPDAWCSVEREYAPAMDTNAFGMVRCVHAFLPLIKRSGHGGRIVCASSIVGRIAYAFGAPYSMTKHAVEAYVDTIRQELRPWGITCCILEPGGFKTPFLNVDTIHERVDSVWERLPVETKEEYGEKYMAQVTEYYLAASDGASTKLHHVVDDYYHAVTARWPRLRYRCGWESLLIYIPASFLPTALEDWMLRRLTGCHRIVPSAVKIRKSRS